MGKTHLAKCLFSNFKNIVHTLSPWAKQMWLMFVQKFQNFDAKRLTVETLIEAEKFRSSICRGRDIAGFPTAAAIGVPNCLGGVGARVCSHKF